MNEQAKYVIPNNAQEYIYEIIDKCTLSRHEEKSLKDYIESKSVLKS